MIHTGAIVASGIAQGLGFRRGFLKKYMDSLRDDKNRREFVAGGGAAGVASAFGTPLGMFCFLSLALDWKKREITFGHFVLVTFFQVVSCSALRKGSVGGTPLWSGRYSSVPWWLPCPCTTFLPFSMGFQVSYLSFLPSFMSVRTVT